MSKKTTTTNTNQYNPVAEGAYNSQVQAGSSALLGEINNPTGNMFFQQQQQMQNLNNANQYSQAQQALGQRLQASGISPSSPLYQQQVGQLQRQNMASGAQGYNSLLLNAGNLRQSAINSAMSFNPQQTGSTSTQTQSGLGSWLPQVVGAGLGMAAGAMTGGASTAMSAVSSGMGGGQSAFQGSPGNYTQGGGYWNAPGAGLASQLSSVTGGQYQPVNTDYSTQQLNPFMG